MILGAVAFKTLGASLFDLHRDSQQSRAGGTGVYLSIKKY